MKKIYTKTRGSQTAGPDSQGDLKPLKLNFFFRGGGGEISYLRTASVKDWHKCGYWV